AAVIHVLAPGRLRLGLGTGHRQLVETAFGLSWSAPQARLREYVTILRTLLQDGSVDFDGKYYHAHARLRVPAPVPVMISALRRRGFWLGGNCSDGIIPGVVCPASYLRDVALPAI